MINALAVKYFHIIKIPATIAAQIFLMSSSLGPLSFSLFRIGPGGPGNPLSPSLPGIPGKPWRVCVTYSDIN